MQFERCTRSFHAGLGGVLADGVPRGASGTGAAIVSKASAVGASGSREALAIYGAPRPQDDELQIVIQGKT